MVPASSLLQLTRERTLVKGAAQDWQRLARQFQENHFLQLEELLEPQLFDYFAGVLAAAKFYPRIYDQVGADETMEENAAWNLLQTLLNDAALFPCIEKITGISPIRSFNGRVYRMNPSPDHRQEWHDDLDQIRQVALSINLSPKLYAGGRLQLCEAGSKKIFAEIANTHWGDAILFQISNDLQHRVTPAEGLHPKVAYAGWFESLPAKWDWEKAENRRRLAGVKEFHPA